MRYLPGIIVTIFFVFLLLSCKKSEDNTIHDADGNVYDTITIGTQVWMKENLKTTRYSNGEIIATTTPQTKDISNENKPKYQWAYDGDESKAASFGRLYTWYTVTDIRNICPTGWHVPSDSEWITLTDYLADNGYGYRGSGNEIAKSIAAKTGWLTTGTAGSVGNDEETNNSSGFTALPGGYRFASGTFTNFGFYGIWWSATEYNDTTAWSRLITSYSSFVIRSYFSNKPYGFSVRCLKD